MSENEKTTTTTNEQTPEQMFEEALMEYGNVCQSIAEASNWGESTKGLEKERHEKFELVKKMFGYAIDLIECKRQSDGFIEEFADK